MVVFQQTVHTEYTQQTYKQDNIFSINNLFYLIIMQRFVNNSIEKQAVTMNT